MGRSAALTKTAEMTERLSSLNNGRTQQRGFFQSGLGSVCFSALSSVTCCTFLFLRRGRRSRQRRRWRERRRAPSETPAGVGNNGKEGSGATHDSWWGHTCAGNTAGYMTGHAFMTSKAKNINNRALAGKLSLRNSHYHYCSHMVLIPSPQRLLNGTDQGMGAYLSHSSFRFSNVLAQ